MKKPMIRIHNTEIDEIIDREMTDEEYEKHLVYLADVERINSEMETKKLARQSAFKKLTALGLEEEEVAALLS